MLTPIILCTYYSTDYYRAYQVRTEARWRAQATRAMMVTRMGYWHKLRARKLQRIISRLHEIMWLLQPEGSAVRSMAEGDAKLTLAEVSAPPAPARLEGGGAAAASGAPVLGAEVAAAAAAAATEEEVEVEAEAVEAEAEAEAEAAAEAAG